MTTNVTPITDSPAANRGSGMMNARRSIRGGWCSMAVLIVIAAAMLAASITPAYASADVSTVMVKDINPSSSSYPSYLTAVGTTLYFIANGGTNGTELWKSNGTDAGTVMVKDINPSSGSYPSYLTAVSTTLYFIANDGTNGTELWKSDGTDVGTVMVKDINPGPGNSFDWVMNEAELTAVGSTLYFNPNDGTNGVELWKTFNETNTPNITSFAPPTPVNDTAGATRTCLTSRLTRLSM